MGNYHYFVSYARRIRLYNGSDTFASGISGIELSEKINSIDDFLSIRKAIAKMHTDTKDTDIFILSGPTLIRDEPY